MIDGLPLCSLKSLFVKHVKYSLENVYSRFRGGYLPINDVDQWTRAGGSHVYAIPHQFALCEKWKLSATQQTWSSGDSSGAGYVLEIKVSRIQF